MEYLADSNIAKELDRRAIEKGIPSVLLMERAALSVLNEINKKFYGDKQEQRHFRQETDTERLKVLIAVNSGNNGGDGLALARMLYLQGEKVSVYMPPVAEEKKTESFAYQLDMVKKLGIRFLKSEEEIAGDWDIIVDGIFGVGLSRNVEGKFGDIIDRLNNCRGFKIALDVPSGIDASSGAQRGKMFLADLTVTFGCMKTGLLLAEGMAAAGEVCVADIGYDEEDMRELCYVTNFDSNVYVPERVDYSNKGTYGKVAVIAGSHDMSGAMSLSAGAAYRMGAGFVKIYTHEVNKVIAGCRVPEALIKTYNDVESSKECAKDAVQWADVILLGPGIGKGEEARAIVNYVLNNCEKKLILDADALNIISEDMSVLNNCKAYLIMTPHVGEMSRLTGKDIKYIRDNSIYVAKDFASEHMKNGGVCVLKDYRCFVADGNGGLYMNVTGNNGMSTAGSGDVLAGMIAGLTARAKLCDIKYLEHKEIFGLPVCRCYNGNDVELVQLVQSAVWLHGKAGDIAAKRKGQYGMIAGDIVEAIPEAIEGAIRHE